MSSTSAEQHALSLPHVLNRYHGEVWMINSGLIGVVIGAVIGLAGSLLPHLYERQRARKSARAIARAYICERNIQALWRRGPLNPS